MPECEQSSLSYASATSPKEFCVHGQAQSWVPSDSEISFTTCLFFSSSCKAPQFFEPPLLTGRQCCPFCSHLHHSPLHHLYSSGKIQFQLTAHCIGQSWIPFSGHIWTPTTSHLSSSHHDLSNRLVQPPSN